MTKNVMSGGYTSQEARNLLLIRGIEHVKGIVPHNAPKIANLDDCEDLPSLWIDYQVEGWANTYSFDFHTYINHGRMTIMYLRLDMKLCWDCNHAIRDYLNTISPMFSFHGDVKEQFCELCGNWENDDIPF